MPIEPRCDNCNKDPDALGYVWHFYNCPVLIARSNASKIAAKVRRPVKLYTGPSACIFCSQPVRSGGVSIDGDPAHAKCMKQEREK